ncbi:hypothetical protein [uncultured Gilvimarinus sp.]|uniref:hypothetical protein n=1 Tax=uncultured Gilvimarinus sp. TaxID=1689143 RepID=UPI0030DA52F0
MTQPRKRLISLDAPFYHYIYHDTKLSGGQTHLRNVKMMPIHHNEDGSIETVNAFAD